MNHKGPRIGALKGMSADKVKTDSSHLLPDGGGGQNKGSTSRQPPGKMEQMSGDLKGEAEAKTFVCSLVINHSFP